MYAVEEPDSRFFHVPRLECVCQQGLVALRADEPWVAVLLQQQQIDVARGLLEAEPEVDDKKVNVIRKQLKGVKFDS
jgi:hypothetical protein